jgi:hypothetical protein
MAKRKDSEATPDQAADGARPTAKATPDATPAMSSQLDLLNVDSPPTAPAAKADSAKPAAAKAEKAEPSKPRNKERAAAASAPNTLPVLVASTPEANTDSSTAKPASRPFRAKRFAMLAASVAFAAALGGIAGALTVGALAGTPARSSDAPATEERIALQKTLTHLSAEVAALKSNLDAANKLAAAQYGKVNERFDRNDKAQAEPAQRLAKIAEAVDRLERRMANTAPETTGSIAPPRIGATPPQATEAKDESRPVVDGWTIRDARNGQVMVQGRSGIYEVVPGAELPGLGKVETIKHQDGRWIVVTQKGLITARVNPRPRPGYFLDDY